jgi:hypothetical protein
MFPIELFCTVSEPVIILEESEQKIRIDVHLPTRLVKRVVAYIIEQFVCGFIDIAELFAEGFEWIIGDRNEFDATFESDDSIAVAVLLSNVFGEVESSPIVDR